MDNKPIEGEAITPPVVESPVVTPPAAEPPVVEPPVVDDKEENWDEALDEVLGAGKKPVVKTKDEIKADEETAAAKVIEDAKVIEQPKAPPTIAEIARDAIKEADTYRTEMETKRKEYHQEVIDTLYPEGVGRQLVDAEGKPINDVSDLKKLINLETNEYFTGDEAATYLLEAQQKLNKELAEFDGGIDKIVDTNISLFDGAKQIQAEYGQLIKALPDVAEKIKNSYMKNQLVLHPKTGIIIGAKMPIEEFYEIAFAPYQKVAEQLELKAQGEKDASAKVIADAASAKKMAEEAAKTAQSERGDISQNGKPIQLTKDDEEWDDAFDQVLGKPIRR